MSLNIQVLFMSTANILLILYSIALLYTTVCCTHYAWDHGFSVKINHQLVAYSNQVLVVEVVLLLGMHVSSSIHIKVSIWSIYMF